MHATSRRLNDIGLHHRRSAGEKSKIKTEESLGFSASDFLDKVPLLSLSLPLFLRPLLGCHCQYNLSSSFAGGGGGGGGVVVVWPRSIIVATCGEVQAFFASCSDRILLKQQQAVELLSLVQLPV